MQPKTLFTAVTDDSQLEGHLMVAAAMAVRMDAHLDVLALGVDTSQASYLYPADAAMILRDNFGHAQTTARELREGVRIALKNMPGLRFAVDTAATGLADLGRAIAGPARFSDLVVMPQPYGKGVSETLEAMVEGALFEGAARVLVLPDERVVEAPERVILAWNESPEAMAAARAALPLLQQAALVKITIVDPPQHGANRSDPGGAMAEFLVRHGVKAEIDLLTKTLPRVSDVILRHASDCGADLIVMGAYGHSRFRESLLGGATRNMLENADRPVFMAHG